MKRLDQQRGKVPDEPDGVGEEQRLTVGIEHPRCSRKRSEQFSTHRPHLASEPVEQSGFSSVCVSDDGYGWNAVAMTMSPGDPAPSPKCFKPPSDPRDSSLDFVMVDVSIIHSQTVEARLLA